MLWQMLYTLHYITDLFHICKIKWNIIKDEMRWGIPDLPLCTSQMVPCVSNLSQSRVIVKRVESCVWNSRFHWRWIQRYFQIWYITLKWTFVPQTSTVLRPSSFSIIRHKSHDLTVMRVATSVEKTPYYIL